MKSLVIAEKPSVARDIAHVLHCNNKDNGKIEGNHYIVTWGLGHLVTLADPEGYHQKYKEWKMEDLPIMPEHFKLEVIKQTRKQYQIVKSLIHRNDVSEIIIATDAGREGELVARLILEKAGNRKPMKRLWISSVTDKAIQQGFAKLKDGHTYDNLYAAAMCRAEADWLVGMNATRALTCKYNAQLSCGRVQTPTLAIIASREYQIHNFIPKTYYGISASYGKPAVNFTWRDGKSESCRSFDRERTEQIFQRILQTDSGTIVEIKQLPKKIQPPQLYDLTELQREANRRFNYSAKETLNIMQRLYENHKVLTYPRTDSRYLSSDMISSLKERLNACAVGPYRVFAGKLNNQKIPSSPSFVNDKKVTDHHAIIPTEQYVQLMNMTNEERKIYDLVVRRFIAVMYPSYEYEQTEVTIKVAGETLLARGKVVKNLGWKEVYSSLGETEDSVEEDGILREQTLPKWKKGDVLTGMKFVLTDGKTKPPAHFNEATLLSAMENPVAYMVNQDHQLAKTLGETGGLGTVATRADIIEKLFATFLLEKKGKDILLTSKARQLLELVPEDLKKPELTAEWEMKLSKIAEGKEKRASFMKDIRMYSSELVQQIKTGKGTFRHENLTNTKCPVCGKRMLQVKGKNSEMLVCQDRGCGHRETIARISNARCPVCHKKLELRGKAEGQIFVCKCGYKEKLTAFKERRSKEGAGVSKKDVAKYLNQQKKDTQEPINAAFADAFAKLNLGEWDDKK